MSINITARCDTRGCPTFQILVVESPTETGQAMLDTLKKGGWGVEGTFTEKPRSVRLTCPFCMRTHGKPKGA